MWQFQKKIANELQLILQTETQRSHQCYVTVVPCVVINQCGPVCHAGNLIPVVPPRHHTRVLVCVLPQPIISLPEVIEDVASPNRGKKEKEAEYCSTVSNSISVFTFSHFTTKKTAPKYGRISSKIFKDKNLKMVTCLCIQPP